MEAQDVPVVRRQYQLSTVLKEEVRFAVVMYGGISLCIYMNGITDQLWHAVRATAREAEDDSYLAKLQHNDPDRPILRVYRRLGQLRTVLSDADESPPRFDDAESHCRIVVDILSGTSAGGINSLFLSKALSCEETLGSLMDLWIGQGDISLLLNDPGSIEKHVPNETPPQSLLNSRRMAQELLGAFRDMDHDEVIPAQAEGSDGRSRLVEQLDLYMTSTDLEGLDLSLQIDSDTTISEVRNKAVFHFVNDPMDTPVIGAGTVRNDFVKEMIPFLSFVARATSCIVPAFEPMQLNDIASLYDKDPTRYDPATSWRLYAPFYRDYWSNSNIAASTAGSLTPEQMAKLREMKQKEFATRSFGDGGYGNNYPFNWAIDSLASRRAELKVDRKLIYVEPDPDLSPDETVTQQLAGTPESNRPSVFEHLAAAGGVKTAQPIRDQIDRLRERNRLLAHLSQIRKSIGAATAMLPTPTNAYYRLRASATTDGLTDIIASLFGFEHDSIYWEAIRYVAHSIREPRYPGADTGRLESFLGAFDLDYRTRQISFLVGEIDERLASATDELGALRAAKQELLKCDTYIDHWYASIRLHGSVDFIQDPADPTDPNARIPTGPDSLRYVGLRNGIHVGKEMGRVDGFDRSMTALARVAGVVISIDDLKKIVIDGGDDEARQLRADRLVNQGAAEMFVNQLVQVLEPLLGSVDTVIRANAGAAGLTNWHDLFEKLDCWLFPAYYVSGAPESKRVDILRVSPLDCRTLVADQEDAKHKLAGTGLGHFSGFFHPAWRGEDVLWGRLDGAERLICSVLDQGGFERSLLILQAQLAILASDSVDTAVATAMDATPGLAELQPNQTIKAFRATRLVQALDSFKKVARPFAGSANPRRGSFGALAAANDRAGLLAQACRDCDVFGPDEPQLLADLRALLDSKLMYARVQLEPRRSLELVGRSVKVVGNILDGLSKSSQIEGRASSTLLRIGTVIVAMVKIVTPGAAEGALYRNWLALLATTTAVTLGIGVFNDSVQKAGYSLLGITLLIVAAVESTRLALSNRGLLKQIGLFVVAFVLFGLLGFGVFAFLHGWLAPDVKVTQSKYLAAGMLAACLLVVATAWSIVITGPTAELAGKNRFWRRSFLFQWAASIVTVALFWWSMIAFESVFSSQNDAHIKAVAAAGGALLAMILGGYLFGRLSAPVQSNQAYKKAIAELTKPPARP